MWQKLTALPVNNGHKWRTVVLLEQNEEGETHIEWDQDVLLEPTGVRSALRTLEEAAIEAQMELMSQRSAA